MKHIQIPCVGYEISADWYEGTSTNQILLVLTGWPSSAENYQELVSYIVEHTGTSALVIDYTGQGRSPFSGEDIRPAQHFLEVITAFDGLLQKHPGAHISVMGTSYGGYMATKLTKYREFDNLVLCVPGIFQPLDFYTLNKNIDREWARKVFRKDKAALAKHPLLARAANFKGKTLVVVHELDEAIPTETTDAFIKTFNADVYLAQGFKHSFSQSTNGDQEAYRKAICDWLNKHKKVAV